MIFAVTFSGISSPYLVVAVIVVVVDVADELFIAFWSSSVPVLLEGFELE